MNWPLAIDRNRAALAAVVAAVAALIGGRDAAGPIARRLRNAALALLRPAEAAARRLIVVAARGLVVRPAPARPLPPAAALREALATRPAQGGGRGGRIPAFPLFDRWKRFRPQLARVRPAGVPRIRVFGRAPLALAPVAPPAAAGPPKRGADPEAPVEIGRLRLRLRSLERALADLPHQARRLARWTARRAAAAPTAPPRAPLRPGRPPGHRRRPDRPVDLLLRECHALACAALRPDTS